MGHANSDSVYTGMLALHGKSEGCNIGLVSGLVRVEEQVIILFVFVCVDLECCSKGTALMGAADQWCDENTGHMVPIGAPPYPNSGVSYIQGNLI